MWFLLYHGQKNVGRNDWMSCLEYVKAETDLFFVNEMFMVEPFVHKYLARIHLQMMALSVLLML